METKQEMIDRWCQIIPSVFRAEDIVQERGDWKERLRVADKLSDEEREKLANDYVRAIAGEIVG